MSNRPSVLVTRPSGQAEALCHALNARGYKAFHQPLLELQGLPDLPPEAEQCIKNIDQYQHLIFISGNAVRFGMEEIHARWPHLPDAIQVYAIGGGTEKKLREYDIEAVCTSPAMTSESLLSMPRLHGVAGHKILIVKGLGGRTTLREVLSKRGAQVSDLACYRRICPSLAEGELAYKLSKWQIGLILISSGEGLCNLLTLLSAPETINLCTVPVIVPSRRVARMAEDAGFTTVYRAGNASNSAMLEMVEHSSLMSENNA